MIDSASERRGLTMIRGLSAASSGLAAQQTRLAVTANNVANANTTGFKRAVAQFQESPGGGVALSAIQPDVSPGSLQLTDRPTDAAITGPGFFPLVGTDGQAAYTRAGAFQINANGSIVTPTGQAVGTQGGTLAVRTFPNPAGLAAVGDGNYQETGASGTSRAGANDSVVTGALEQSNTDLSDEALGMVVALGAYKANLKTVQTLDSMLKTVINLRR
jgi:flagellar basal-body rod protein FlgG